MKQLFFLLLYLFTSLLPGISSAQDIAQAGEPLTLQNCYELALSRSETVAIAKEDIEEAKAQIFKAASEFFGDIDFISSNTRQDSSGGSGGTSSVGGTLSAESRRERKFLIEQPLFQGFKSLGAVTGADAFKNQKKETWIRSRESLLFEVAHAFYEILRLKKDIAIVEEIHQLFSERVHELKEREKIGRSRQSEVVNAVSRMKNLEASLVKSKGELKSAGHFLDFLTGASIDSNRLKEEEIENDAQPDPNIFIARAENRSDVEAARMAVKVAWDAVIVAQSEFWPKLNLTHNHFEHRDGFQSGITWDLLLKLDVPLFRGGENLGKFKEAVSRWKKAKLNYSLVFRKAELEIKQSYEEWFSSADEYPLLVKAVKASKKDFELQLEEYGRNLVSNLDVLDALERLNASKRDANQAYYEMKQNYWKLKVAVGEIPSHP